MTVRLPGSTARSDVPGSRWWRRIERRALRAHERYTLATLQRLAADRVPVLDRLVPAGHAAAVGLLLPDHWVAVAGAPGPVRMALELAADDLQLCGAGRYAGCWWLALEPRHSRTPFDGTILLTASRLQLIQAMGGGRRHAPDPHAFGRY